MGIRVSICDWALNVPCGNISFETDKFRHDIYPSSYTPLSNPKIYCTTLSYS